MKECRIHLCSADPFDVTICTETCLVRSGQDIGKIDLLNSIQIIRRGSNSVYLNTHHARVYGPCI